MQCLIINFSGGMFTIFPRNILFTVIRIIESYLFCFRPFFTCMHFSHTDGLQTPGICIFVFAKLRYNHVYPLSPMRQYLPSSVVTHPSFTVPYHTLLKPVHMYMYMHVLYTYIWPGLMLRSHDAPCRVATVNASAHHVWQELNNLNGLMTDIKQWGMPVCTGAVGEARRSTHLFSSGFMSVASLCIQSFTFKLCLSFIHSIIFGYCMLDMVCQNSPIYQACLLYGKAVTFYLPGKREQINCDREGMLFVYNFTRKENFADSPVQRYSD